MHPFVIVESQVHHTTIHHTECFNKWKKSNRTEKCPTCKDNCIYSFVINYAMSKIPADPNNCDHPIHNVPYCFDEYKEWDCDSCHNEECKCMFRCPNCHIWVNSWSSFCPHKWHWPKYRKFIGGDQCPNPYCLEKKVQPVRKSNNYIQETCSKYGVKYIDDEKASDNPLYGIPCQHPQQKYELTAEDRAFIKEIDKSALKFTTGASTSQNRLTAPIFDNVASTSACVDSWECEEEFDDPWSCHNEMYPGEHDEIVDAKSEEIGEKLARLDLLERAREEGQVCAKCGAPDPDNIICCECWVHEKCKQSLEKCTKCGQKNYFFYDAEHTQTVIELGGSISNGPITKYCRVCTEGTGVLYCAHERDERCYFHKKCYNDLKAKQLFCLCGLRI